MSDKTDEYKLLKDLLSEFRFINKKIYMADFSITILLSWPLFFYACFNEGAYSTVLYVISIFAIYRGTIFIHEVAHFEKDIKGFKLIYNIFFGWANCFPAYLYTPHFFHHGKKTYGTAKDPEYLFMKNQSKYSIYSPIILAFFVPFYHFARFAVLPLFYFILPEQVLVKIFKKYSTLVMNINYERRIRYDYELNEMKKNDLLCALYKWLPLILVYLGYLPFKTIYLYFFALYIAMLLNMYRAKFNHRYENPNIPMSDMDQLLENVTVEGGIISELWSPTSLRFHTIHHVVQDIPYHNLKKAHQKLKRELPKGHPYFKTIESSFLSAWKSHYQMLKNT